MLDADSIWESKRNRLQEPKIKPLTDLVETMRAKTGYEVPYLDPDDGGVGASVLLILADPGPGAIKTGFISRDNYRVDKRDLTAKNVLDISNDTRLDRELTVSWNAVPWPVDREKSTVSKEVERARKKGWLEELLDRLPEENLCVVVLLGATAREMTPDVYLARPDVHVLHGPHPRLRGGKPSENRRWLEATFRKARKLALECHPERDSSQH